MTQYHFLDDSGDPGLSGIEGSSSHFVLAMVQLAERAPLKELAAVRQTFHLSPKFEFKYHKTTTVHKETFFKAIRPIPFRVRAIAVDKARLGKRLTGMSGQDISAEFIKALVLRATELDIANDVLIVDGITPAFRRALRLTLSEECRRAKRIRPFNKIISGDSIREDGLQLADMIVGAIRQHIIGKGHQHYRSFASKIVDLSQIPP